MSTLLTLQPYVTDSLQGRTDISAQTINNYLAKAILELTQGLSFDELKVTGPQFALTSGTSIYPISSFLNANDTYDFPESMAIFIDVGTNQVVGPVDYKGTKAIEVMAAPATQGIPSRFARFGSNFIFGPTPNANYTVYLRYQRQHPFSSPPANGDTVYVPAEWEEAVYLSAALRIANIKRWPDQIQVLKMMLYGDPNDPVNPGVIKRLKTQIERDQMFNSRQLTVVTARYNPR